MACFLAAGIWNESVPTNIFYFTKRLILVSAKSAKIINNTKCSKLANVDISSHSSVYFNQYKIEDDRHFLMSACSELPRQKNRRDSIKDQVRLWPM